MQFQFSDDNLQMQRTLARVELAKAREKRNRARELLAEGTEPPAEVASEADGAIAAP